MKRVLVGVCVGWVCGVLSLAGFGAWEGYTWVHEWFAGPASTPEEDAVKWAFVFIARGWWLGGSVGGVIGGLAGLGSWLVRPRPAIKTRTEAKVSGA
jgi:hypothetical protein